MSRRYDKSGPVAPLYSPVPPLEVRTNVVYGRYLRRARSRQGLADFSGPSCRAYSVSPDDTDETEHARTYVQFPLCGPFCPTPSALGRAPAPLRGAPVLVWFKYERMQLTGQGEARCITSPTVRYGDEDNVKKPRDLTKMRCVPTRCEQSHSRTAPDRKASVSPPPVQKIGKADFWTASGNCFG